MKTFIINWEKELKKYFSETETKEIVSYYKEIIQERLDHNEDLDDILASYDPKQIVKEMMPDVVIKREKTTKNMMRSTKGILLLLLTTPLLIPLGIVSLVLIIVFSAMIVTGFALVGGGFVVVMAYLVEVFRVDAGLSEQLVFVGTGLIGATVLSLVGMIMIVLFKKIVSLTTVAMSRFVRWIGGKKWKY